MQRRRSRFRRQWVSSERRLLPDAVARLLTIADNVTRLTLGPAARSLEISSAENAALSGEHKQMPWERVMMLNAPTDGRLFGLDRVDWIMLLGGAAVVGLIALLF